MMGRGVRYLRNPFKSDPAAGAIEVTDEFLRNEAIVILGKLLKKKLSDDDFHGGPYVGGAGIAYALFRAGKALSYKQEEVIEKGEYYLAGHMTSRSNREAAYLCGALGIYTVFVLHDSSSTKGKQLLERINEIGLVMAVRDLYGNGDDEMLNGRAGYLAAAFELRSQLGAHTIPDIIIRDVMKKVISTGRDHARKLRHSPPLMYDFHDTHYLGSAHGLMGTLQMLLTFYVFLDDGEKKDVLGCLDWIVSAQSSNGNISTRFENIKRDRGDDELVHWCHGAQGLVHLMIVAYEKLHDRKYIECAERALNLIWDRGVLLKGPGICHGVAGSGYACLLFYRLTKDSVYLQRARCFARICCSPDFLEKARTPDCPFSLFEGIAGTLCFFCDMLDPENAQFPLISIPFSS